MARSLSTFAIAEMLHVDPGSVANWIDQGLLKAHRTPGGHRRVVMDNLLAFLKEHKMPIPPELGPTPVKILVVDDEQAITKLIVRAIKSKHSDYEIVEAHDGFQAGTLIATMRPDVVILDLRMPGMDGYEVCRMIKAQDTTKHAEVIAVTAYPSPESQQQIIDCGARICLAKPLDIEQLLAEIEKSL
ncbi:MAG: response regulator [Phycisphaerae bacterium]|nr:response regulator [Phycisphaerae bacterium]